MKQLETRFWVIAILSSKFGQKFPGIRDAALARKSLIAVLHTGDFTAQQKRRWLQTLKTCYEHACRKNKEPIYPFPKHLRKYLTEEQKDEDHAMWFDAIRKGVQRVE